MTSSEFGCDPFTVSWVDASDPSIVTTAFWGHNDHIKMFQFSVSKYFIELSEWDTVLETVSGCTRYLRTTVRGIGGD